MPSDHPSDNDIHVVLNEIRGTQERQGEMLRECHEYITGGKRVGDGIAYRLTALEHQTAKDSESRSFWMRTIGTTAVGAFITGICAIVFKSQETGHP
ncbi:MAG: hypothetical protein EBR82_50680 [Caulobacteraceae bacterium]|nr:hypothetical protein [Caulobacteraceae bacterium]